MQNNKKNWWVTCRSRGRVRVRVVNGVRDRVGVRGLDRVRTGGEHDILFEKHPPPPSPQKKIKVENHLVRTN